MMLLKSVVSREDLKCPVSALTQEVGQYDDENTVVFLNPMIDLICQLVSKP